MGGVHAYVYTCVYVCMLYIYIYIYIYSHPQTDCFIVSQLFSVDWKMRRSKP